MPPTHKQSRNSVEDGEIAARSDDWSRRAMLSAGGAAAIVPPGAAASAGRLLQIRSPNGEIALDLDFSSATPMWRVERLGEIVLAPSPLGLILAGGAVLGRDAEILGRERRRIRGRWRPTYAIRASCDQACESLTVRLRDRSGIQFDVVARAYDAGVALRYVLREAPRELSFEGEATAFCFADGARVYASRDEGEYEISAPGAVAPRPHPELTGSSDAGPLADLPATVILPNGLSVLIAESDRLHYPRAMLAPGEGANALRVHLMRYPGRATGYSGPGDTPPAPTFSLRASEASPWRVLTIAKRQADLIENSDLIATLATPNVLGDVSWVRPGRAVRIRKPYTTESALAVVEFAARRKLDFVEFDAHWYGDGTDPSDATRPIEGLDLQRVVDAARARAIGVILYVDRVPAMTQLDAIVRTYRNWGVAGIKFGFVWEGRQADNDFIFDLIRVCGEHRLLVNLHDNLRPAGLERTLPNYLTLEGVRGNEQFPTSRHNVTLPFTRAAAGPIDYTICYAHPRNRTTNAHQLAMAAVYYSPMTFLYWYDAPDKYAGREWPELDWFDECPTVWDETRALSGEIGEYVCVARRSGARWFLGAMTNETARSLRVLLNFLDEGPWEATIFADGSRAQNAFETPVVVSNRRVVCGDALDLQLAADGGQAILFSRA